MRYIDPETLCARENYFVPCSLYTSELEWGRETKMQQQQQQQPEAVFKEAVAAVLAQWTLLNLAVEQGWGGRESYKKRQQLYEDLIAEFRDNKRVDAEDLACSLSERLSREFSVSVEDDSDLEVAQLLVELHEQTSRGCFDLAAMVQQQQKQRATAAAQSRCGNAPAAEGDCSMSDGSDEEEALENLMSTVEIAQNSDGGIGTSRLAAEASRTRSRLAAAAAAAAAQGEEAAAGDPAEADGAAATAEAAEEAAATNAEAAAAAAAARAAAVDWCCTRSNDHNKWQQNLSLQLLVIERLKAHSLHACKKTNSE
ncbi:uncharacterized protein EMH_0010680 [Eimeria mitis]|uniref:Pre-rRNA-processing protein TSR2 n=1 Tax=Eimeria mitis TaxID=44415 RepID=U6JW05_9EIME|nr:uncharacterized protein EMH_0010680 [Eimeria mitis]CDJ27703.1 hypothetical protein, conserved [Eimeria mitis]